MRILLLSLLFTAPASAFAVDTSGCSPLTENTRRAETSMHNELTVALNRPNRGDCWNSDQSSIRLNYRFEIAHDAPLPNVKLWVKVNNQDRTVRSYPECRPVQNSYGASGETVCNASVTVPAPKNGPIHVEAAPQLNDSWDTGGYDHNIAFDL